MPADLRITCGGKHSLTPSISSEKLASHGFDRWLTQNMDYHPFLRDRVGRVSCFGRMMNLKSGVLKRGWNSEW
jgi:hypothetical protein